MQRLRLSNEEHYGHDKKDSKKEVFVMESRIKEINTFVEIEEKKQYMINSV